MRSAIQAYKMADETKLKHIVYQVRRGAKLAIGRNPAGSLRVKINRGPFGMIVERYRLTEDELQLLRERLNSQDLKPQDIGSSLQ